MFAQTMLTLSMMLPLFSCVRKHKVSGLILTLGTVLFLLSYLIQPISLYVDTLLPLTGAAGLVLLEEEFKQERKTTWAATALAVAVMLIKNSGIFFWALMALAVLDFGIRHFREVSRQEKLSWGGLLLIPPFYLLLWQKHVKYVFYSGMTAIHSMSLSAYLENFRAKASTSIPVILDAFQDKVRSGRGLLFLLLFILICVLFAHIQHLSGKGLIRLAIYLIAVYAVYQAGNLCMYLFSMPEGEALVMAGYTRYYGAIIIFCYSYAIYHILKWADSISISYHWILCVLSLLLFWKMGANIQPLQRHQIAAARIQLDNLVTEYSIEPSRNYLVFIPENDAYYTYHLFKYVLYTPIVDLHFSADGENFEEVLNTAIDLGYDYFVNLDPDNAQIAEYCLEHYGADAGPVIRLQ